MEAYPTDYKKFRYLAYLNGKPSTHFDWSTRQKKMYEKLKGMQVLMTGTLFRFKPTEKYLSLVVKQAKIKSKICEK